MTLNLIPWWLNPTPQNWYAPLLETWYTPLNAEPCPDCDCDIFTDAEWTAIDDELDALKDAVDMYDDCFDAQEGDEDYFTDTEWTMIDRDTADRILKLVPALEGSNRSDVLVEADDLVNGDRNQEYGDPIDDFRRIASYWNIHLDALARRKAADDGSVEMLTLVDPHDVAIMMMLLKISRLSWSPEKRDHWVDGAGYNACGWDCVVREDDAA